MQGKLSHLLIQKSASCMFLCLRSSTCDICGLNGVETVRPFFGHANMQTVLHRSAFIRFFDLKNPIFIGRSEALPGCLIFYKSFLVSYLLKNILVVYLIWGHIYLVLSVISIPVLWTLAHCVHVLLFVSLNFPLMLSLPTFLLLSLHSFFFHVWLPSRNFSFGFHSETEQWHEVRHFHVFCRPWRKWDCIDFSAFLLETKRIFPRTRQSLKIPGIEVVRMMSTKVAKLKTALKSSICFGSREKFSPSRGLTKQSQFCVCRLWIIRTPNTTPPSQLFHDSILEQFYSPHCH